MNEIQRDISPIRAEEHAARPISPRLYNLIIAGLIFLGFCVMSLGVNIVSTPAFLMWMSRNVLLYMLGSIVGTIAGIVLMSSAVKRQSVARSLVGFALFICTFGLMLSMVLMNYSLPTINTAFLATAGITAVFGARPGVPAGVPAHRGCAQHQPARAHRRAVRHDVPGR